MYISIQGESSHAGRVCVFIRLAGCNLGCAYCDSAPAAKGMGEPVAIEDVLSRVTQFNAPLVEITGGEPLMQDGAGELIAKLVMLRHETLVETNGTCDLSQFDRGAKYIVDIKTPGSGAGGSFLGSNFDQLTDRDEVKFVVTSKADFDWAAKLVRERKLGEKLAILFSPAENLVDPKELAKWLIDSRLNARLNLQIHKYIWGQGATGV